MLVPMVRRDSGSGTGTGTGTEEETAREPRDSPAQEKLHPPLFLPRLLIDLYLVDGIAMREEAGVDALLSLGPN